MISSLPWRFIPAGSIDSPKWTYGVFHFISLKKLKELQWQNYKEENFSWEKLWKYLN